jgi:hypothetical protein
VAIPWRPLRRETRPRPAPRPGTPAHAPQPEHGTSSGLPLYLQNRPASADGEHASGADLASGAQSSPDAQLSSVPEGVSGVPSAEAPSAPPAPSSSAAGASSSADEVLWSEDPSVLASSEPVGASADDAAPLASDAASSPSSASTASGESTTSAGPDESNASAAPDSATLTTSVPSDALETTADGEAEAAVEEGIAESADAATSAGGTGAPDAPGGTEDEALRMSIPTPPPVPADVGEGARVAAPQVRTDARPAEPAASAAAPGGFDSASSLRAETRVAKTLVTEVADAVGEETGPDAESTSSEAPASGAPAAAAEQAVAESRPAEEAAPPAAALASPRGGGGGGGPGLGAWRAQVAAATESIPQPDAGDAAAATAPIAQAGSQAAARHQAEAAAVPAEGQAQLPPQQEPVPATPPDPGPVPEAARLVDEAAARTLDPQSPPDFEASPQGFMPVMGQNPVSPDVLRRLIDTPPALVSDPADPERTRLEEMRLALLEPQLTDEQASGRATPVADQRPPPEPALPAETAVDIGRVLAHLLADPQAEARQMLGRVRQGYAGGALQAEMPTLGDDDLAPALATELERQVRGIAAEAGVAADALQSAVADRQSVLEERRRVAEAEVSSTTQLYSEQVQSAGQGELDAVAGTRAQLDAAATQAESAAQAADPEAIGRQRDRLIDDVTARAASGATQLRQAGERRQGELDRAVTGQASAYRAAAQQDELKLRTQAPADRTAAQTEDLVAASRAWSTRRSEASGTAIRELKRAATENVDRLQAGLSDAADGARERIRTWAEAQSGERRSWWDRLMDWVGDWTRQARANAEAWERVRNQRAARSIAADLQTVQQLEAAARQGMDAAAATGGRRLSAEQQAVVDSFFGTGADARDPLAAVAAGTRARILGERRGELTTQLEARLLRDDVDADALERVAQGVNPGFSAARVSSELHQAMHGGVTGWGTDEDQAFRALAGLSRLESAAVRRMYRAEYGTDLQADLDSEMDDDDERRALALLEGDQNRAAVAELHAAMDQWGTDEAAIMNALRGRSAEDREQIVRLYREQYGVDLNADLRSEMEGHDLDRAEALVEGDTARADAIELQQAMSGVGTDEAALEGVYSRIRDEVHRQAEREGWTSAQMEAEIRRRGGEVESTFNARFGQEWGTGEGSALRRAFADEMDPGPQLELVNALADNDLVRADAARLAVERDSFVTDDEVVNNVLRSQYDRALQATRLDDGPRLREALAEEERRTGPWDPYERRRREREIERQLESTARVRAGENMAALERTYDTQFSQWGPGSMRTMIEWNTSGTERERARDLVSQGGYLSPAQEIHYAVQGAGTDEDAIRRALEGRSPEEVEEIRRQYASLSGGESMETRLTSELDGRDLHETRLALRGEPRNAQEEIEQMRERARYERENTGTMFGLLQPGSLGGSAELARMERRTQRMEQAYAAVNEPGLSADERARRLQRFQQYTGQVRVSTDEVRHQAEAVADALATTAGVVAAIVVIVAASIVTGGGAAAVGVPALMSALGSGGVAAASAAASVAATILTRRAILGESYGGEQIGIDIAVGVVDAVAAYATAGMGNALLKAVEGAPVGMLARMATSSSRATRMLAHGLAEGAEGFVSTLPSALTGNVLNDDNWRHGNAALNILAGTAFETGIGTVVSGGMGSLGGWTRQVDAPPVRETGDVLAHRGTPAERMAQYRAFRAENPDVPYEDWVRAFDAGVVARREADDAQRLLQRQLRTELLAGIPPADRRQFADAVVEVMDDAEFTRRFGSVRGQAVTLIENGKPRVVLRESADPSALREEGIHMLQSVDPRTRAAVSRLDEARLADWNRMDLGEQLSLYRTKMDLEIDAQERLIRGLEDDLARTTDDATRRGLRDALENADANLGQLRGRVDELDAITPERALRMARDPRLRPPYLDQPARLFAKRAPITELPTVPPGRGAGAAYQMYDKVRGKLPPGYAWEVDPASVEAFRAGSDLPVYFRVRRLDPALPELTLVREGRYYQLRDLGTDYPPAPRGYHYVPVAGGTPPHQLARVPGLPVENPDVDLQLKPRQGGGFEVGNVERRQLTWPERKANLAEGYETSVTTQFKDFEDRLAALGLSGDDTGTLRRWWQQAQMVSELLDAVPGSPSRAAFLDEMFAAARKKMGTGPGGAAVLGEAAYDEFRETLRRRTAELLNRATGMDMAPMLQRLAAHQHLADRLQLGKKNPLSLLHLFLESQPDGSASKGHLFTAYREARMVSGGEMVPMHGERAMTVVREADGRSVTRTADGALMVTSAPTAAGAPGAGPHLLEDKAGPGAFKLDQAEDYARGFGTRRAAQVLPPGVYGPVQEYQGIVYFFDNVDNARAAFTKMQGSPVTRGVLGRRPGGIFVSYIDSTGNIAWLQ